MNIDRLRQKWGVTLVLLHIDAEKLFTDIQQSRKEVAEEQRKQDYQYFINEGALKIGYEGIRIAPVKKEVEDSPLVTDKQGG
jgi:hypothetical protein